MVDAETERERLDAELEEMLSAPQRRVVQVSVLSMALHGTTAERHQVP